MINPKKRQLKYLFIDSRHRDYGTPEDFRYSIDPTIFGIKTFSLVSAEIPYTIYPVRANNNIIYWTDSGSNVLSATMIPGFYSGSAFATELAFIMTTESASSGASDVYTGTFSIVTFKVNISVAAGTFNFTMTTNTLNSIRFISGYTIDTSAAANHTSDQVVRLTGDHQVYIRVDMLSGFSYLGIGSEGDGTTTQPARLNNVYKIPALVNPGEVIQYINFNDKLNTFVVQTGGGMSLSHLKIRLEYYDGEILDLNGSEWNLTLSINNGKCDGGCSK